jgi:predicted Zn-dependent peptidase
MFPNGWFRTAWRAAGLLIMLQAPAIAQIADPAASIDERSKVVREVAAGGGDDLRSARQGRLANGLRFAILPRSGNEPGFTVYMRVAGGFYAERRPGERGLVHLIEHIAFKGSSHLEPGALQRIGQPITFPAPSAASTSWQNSSYYLNSRSGDRQSVDTLLMLLREIGSELTFPEAGVREARAEVLKEMAEKRAGNAIFANYIAAVAPGSPNDVINAQNSDDVPTASMATLRNLYHRLYRPDRTSIIIVGTVDPDVAEALIRQHFDSWKATSDRAIVTNPPTFDRGKIRHTSYSADPAGRSVVTVSVTMKLPSATKDTDQRLRDRIMDLASAQAASTRLKRGRKSAPPGKVGATIENADGYRLIRTWDFAEPDQWGLAVTLLRQQTCDMYRDGWTQEEWEAAKNATLAEMRAYADERMNQKNIDVAGEIADADADARQILSRRELANYAAAWLPSVNVSQANARWRREWRTGLEHIRVETPKLAGSSSPLEEVSRTIDRGGGIRCRR